MANSSCELCGKACEALHRIESGQSICAACVAEMRGIPSPEAIEHAKSLYSPTWKEDFGTTHLVLLGAFFGFVGFIFITFGVLSIGNGEGPMFHGDNAVGATANSLELLIRMGAILLGLVMVGIALLASGVRHLVKIREHELKKPRA